MLGGSSSINGTIYMRGQPRDYDGWRQRGLEGWDWDSVLPFFIKGEDNERGADGLHGAGGPLKVSDVPTEWELHRAMVAAAVEAGIPANPDFNGPEQEGSRLLPVHRLAQAALEFREGLSRSRPGSGPTCMSRPRPRRSGC